MPIDPLGRVWNSQAIRRFAAQAALVIIVVSTGFVVAIHLRSEQLIESGIRQQAESYLDVIVTTRAWNAAHRGVWVERHGGVLPNPYLRDLGIEPETSTASGTRLVLRNPAAMTREISELTAHAGEVRFRLTSLDPVNPGNAPDEWERRQLELLENGITQAEGYVDQGGRRTFRLMRPLVADEQCLPCHAAQGYETGDVRGAISVSLDVDEIETERRRNAMGLAALWVIVVGGVSVLMYGLVFRMAERIEKGEAQLRVLASTDELTGLANRRVTFERLETELARMRRGGGGVGVVSFDLDHFKNINDTLGHAAGDVALQAVADVLKQSVRVYDIVGRVGGEEFLVVAPDIEHEDLTALAERVRSGVEALTARSADGEQIRVTVSAGCALSESPDETLASLITRADRSLYRAKDGGRNRVECD